MAPADGFVVAIYGPWGSGKSTVLNFIQYHMEKEHEPVVIQFNPWWFSGQDDLAFMFLVQLQIAIAQRAEASDELKQQFSRFAHILSPLPGIGGFAESAKRLLDAPEGIVKLKADIASKLQELGQRVFVFIDDIDRLAAEEIRQVFRLIKAVADFPYVTYVLAMDKQVAIRALDTTQNIPGEEYLEKIVQAPYELPLPDRAGLQRMLFPQLDAILAGTQDAHFDQYHWSRIYLKGIDGLIRTPRDVARLVNALAVTYPAVLNEVNAVDFIGIEALRVFCPGIYDVVRRNLDMFTGNIRDYQSPSADELKAFHAVWPETVGESTRQSIKDLLTGLFPKLEAVWGNTHHGDNWLDKVTRELRICSPDVCTIYFRFSVPDQRISNAEMLATIGCAALPQSFSAELLRLVEGKRPDGTTRARGFLQRLHEFTGDRIPIEYAPNAVFTLCSLGDRLMDQNDRPLGGIEIGNDLYVLYCVADLLRRLPVEDRCETLTHGILNGESIAMPLMLVEALHHEHAGEGGAELADNTIVIPSGRLPDLALALLERVQKAATDGTLLQAPRLVQTLNWWNAHGSDGEVKTWLERQVESDSGLVVVLGACLSGGTVTSGYSARRFDRLDPGWLAPFLDTDTIAARLDGLNTKTPLTERQERAVAQYKIEHQMRKGGLDPNSDPDVIAQYKKSGSTNLT